jgi:PAS domain S-box-containing protein
MECNWLLRRSFGRIHIRAALIVFAAVVTMQLLPCSVLANESAGLIEPNRNFVLSREEAQFIQSLAQLRVMIDDNFVPLSHYDTKTGSFQGISVDLFRHLADRLGLQYQFLYDKQLSWAGKVELFKNRKVDLLMPVSFTEERASVGIFTASFYETCYGAIARKTDNIKIAGAADLAKYRVGVTKSSAIIPYIQSFVPSIRIYQYDNQNDLYQGVMKGHIDIALQNKNVFQEDRFNLGFVDLALIYTIVESPRKYSYYLNKTETNKRLATIIDRYLAGIDKSKLLAYYDHGEDELILRYTEQKQQKKLLVIGIFGSLALSTLIGMIYFNHRSFSAKLAVSLEQVQHQKERLQKSEEKYRGLFDNSRDALMILEPPSWKYTSGNQATVDMFWADSEEDFTSHSPWDLSPERQADGRASVEKAREMNEIALRDGYHFFEWTHQRIGGEEFFADVFLTRIEEGDKVMIQATVRDITKRKQTENALSENRKQLKDIINFLPDATLAIDKEKRVIIWNRAIEEMTGVPAEEMIGKGEYAYTIPFYGEPKPQLMDLVFEYSEDIASRYLNLSRVGDTFTAEVFCKALNDNKGAWLFLKASPLLDQSGNITGAIESIRDITERKRAMLEIINNKRRYHAIVTAFDGQIYICSQDYRIVFMNEKLIERTGSNAIGESCFNVLHNLDAVCSWCVNERVFKGETVKWEVQSPKDGRWYYVVNSPIYNDDGTVFKQAMIQDITERKQTEEENRRLEQQFHHAQKLESIGLLAGGIAHDFNNILTVILGHCYLAREDLHSDQEYRASFQQIESAGNRAANLCRQMMSYAGKSPMVQTRISLWQVVDEVVTMLQSAMNKNVAIELDLNQRVPDIMGDIGQIQQIVMNLIINAAEAIGDANGTIRIRLAENMCGLHQGETDTFDTVLPGTYACLEVTDSGCGMNEETQKRIFEPFFTTKSTGRGLGMSAISGIIKSHKGMLQLSSTPGFGTTFKVFFPVPEVFDFAETAPSALVLPESKGGTILLVEDEQSLCIMGTALFEALGFSVVTAQHGREALDIYSKSVSSIDLILLDLIMPVMGGIEAYHKLREIDRNLPIVICSGYSAESVLEVINTDKNACIVHKPYKPDELRDLFIRMMAQAKRLKCAEVAL